MFRPDLQAAPEAFEACWRAAGLHLQARAQGPIFWLKADLKPPFLEHLSFRLGNQLLHVRIEDEDGHLDVPGSLDGLRYVADACKGIACLMPMRQRIGRWGTTAPGWGLIDAMSGKALDPVELVTDELIPMSEWEVHGVAVQAVGNSLKSSGKEILQSHGNPEVDPSIWFAGEAGPEWIVVRAVRYPDLEARMPDDWKLIAAKCVVDGARGHFASVSVVSANQPFATKDEPCVPLWRGHPMFVRFTGLISGPDA